MSNCHKEKASGAECKVQGIKNCAKTLCAHPWEDFSQSSGQVKFTLYWK